MLAIILAFAITALVLRSGLNLWKNVRSAKAAGLPVIASPVSPSSPFWMICSPLLLPLLRRLPFGLESFTKFVVSGWNYFDRYTAHQELGKVFALATPSSLGVFVADAAASDEIFIKKKQFGKPTANMKAIEVFGPTVATVEGAEWQRHRRITATPFNARNNQLVWTESITQGRQMLEYWADQGAAGTNTFAADCMTLALHVITSAGFGKSYKFREEAEQRKEPRGRMTYRDCLETVLQHVILIAAVPRWVYAIPLLPQKLHRFREAKIHLQEHMVEMVSAAREKLQNETTDGGNLLSNLVRQNEEARREDGSAKIKGVPHGLTDEEMYGNFFIFSFAGHETTAHTLSYTFYHLAAMPQWQDWIQEELDYVLRDSQSVETLDFHTTFPQLKRCLAFMYESLRLYPPVLNIPKCNSLAAYTIESGDKPVTIPENALVWPNVVALHTHPDYWGQDSLEWRPSRWITASDTSGTPEKAGTPSPEEELKSPVTGSYIPWGDGPRVCPGRKFSQVEFVATMVTIFWKNRLEVVSEAGESEADAQSRVKAAIVDSVHRFTLNMRAPEKVKIRLLKR